MDKNSTERINTRKMFRLLPLFGIVICVLLVLVGILLSVAKIDKTVCAVGSFEPYPRIDVKATIKDTVIDDILVKIGQRVEEGEVLMRLRDQHQSKEKIIKLKARLKFAGINFERLKKLSAQGCVAVKDKEKAELVKNMLMQEMSALEKVAQTLEIAAPSAGTVAGIPVEIGDRVDMGKKLLLLASSQERALRMWIEESLSSEIKVGQAVRIYSRVFPYRKYGTASGKIVEINSHPKIRNDKNYVEAVARITKFPFPIRVGSQAEARIVIKRSPVLKLLFER